MPRSTSIMPSRCKADHPLTGMENVTLSAHAAFRTLGSLDDTPSPRHRHREIASALTFRTAGTLFPPAVVIRPGEWSMAEQKTEQKTLPAVAAHGSLRLPAVEIDSYNIEAQGRRGLHRRPRQQRRVSRHHRELAKAAAQSRRRSVRRQGERRSDQEAARRAPRPRARAKPPASCMARSRISRRNSRS